MCVKQREEVMLGVEVSSLFEQTEVMTDFPANTTNTYQILAKTLPNLRSISFRVLL